MATRKQAVMPKPSRRPKQQQFRIKVVIHPAPEGGFWAEVPALPGCFSEGETLREVQANIREAIKGCLSVDVKEVEVAANDIVEEIEL